MTLAKTKESGGASVKKNNFELTFKSQLDYLDIVQEFSEGVGRMAGLDEDGRYWIGLSVRESVINAILHGNQQDESKNVGISFRLDPGRIVIRVRDEGNGFDEKQLPNPLDTENLLKPSGRGIFYVRSFMDTVHYRGLPEGGWEMRMEKRLNHQNQGERDAD